jgi:uncharacterized protein YjbI with pentapeptide repeats
MTLKIEDVEEYTEKTKENKGGFSENLKKDLSIFSTTIQKYPLISLFFIFAAIFLFVFPYIQVHFHEINNVTKEAELENQYRATLAQIFGGIAIAIGLYYTWRRIGIAEKDLQVTKESQITERFTRAVDQLGAIDQLGNPAIEIRLGGIYALERISKESEDDYWPIIEILIAYVRKNSSFQVAANKKVMRLSMDIQANESTIEEATKVSLDIQAILTVIGRRKHSFNDGEDIPLNLRGICLQGVNLEGAHLEGADLRDAHLEGADLSEAHLEEALLSEAHLERADLRVVHLEEAVFLDAHLEWAVLTGAHLEGAVLTGAHLEGADLEGAQFEGAILSEAHLERADLMMAHLEGAKYLTIDQLSKVKALYLAKLDEELLIPLEDQYPDLFKPPN